MKTGKDDLKWMREALKLARRGLGKTSPNPAVGAVLVRNGKLIGKGWHRKAGLPHAEVEALMDAGRKKINVRGSSLYVTLEPCSTWGKTPPCIDAIRAHGIRRVVIGAVDPNPRHQGRGISILKKSGVHVVSGILEKECRDLNRAWNHWMTLGKPWVIAKCGMTLDGKIATADGESQWITSEPQRKDAHRLRAAVDAVLVGIQTVLKDNPRLNVRHGLAGRQPIRVILDGKACTPTHAKLFKTPGGEVWIFVRGHAEKSRLERLKQKGARIFQIQESHPGRFLRQVLKVLGKKGVTHLLVEGGGETLGGFFDAGLVHEWISYVSPRILGGAASIKAVAGMGCKKWREGTLLGDFSVRKMGGGLKISGTISSPSMRDRFKKI